MNKERVWYSDFWGFLTCINVSRFFPENEEDRSAATLNHVTFLMTCISKMLDKGRKPIVGAQ